MNDAGSGPAGRGFSIRDCGDFMKKLAIAVVALAGLGGCTYYTPPPYSYVPVPCPPGSAGSVPAPATTPASPGASSSTNPSAGTVTPAQPSPPPAEASTACVAVVPNYTYYPYPGYYYPYPGYYYGPPVYGSVFVRGRFR